MSEAQSAGPLARPRLRGVLHQGAFFLALACGATLVVASPDARARLAAAIYATSVACLFGVSALYHRRSWSADARRRMRRLDHSMIFLLIAGTYTPFCLLTFHGTLAWTVLAVVWAGALLACFLQVAWIGAPKWLQVVLALALGWAVLPIIPRLISDLGASGSLMMLAGGLLYSAGGMVYALRRPTLSRDVFGYHELFHLLVVAAAAFQYAVVAFWVLDLG